MRREAGDGGHAQVALLDGRLDVEVAGGGRGGVRAVAVVVARGDEGVGGRVGHAEAVDVEARADQLVVALELRVGADGARPLPAGGRAGEAGAREARVAGVDAAVDDADDDAAAGVIGAADVRPQPLRQPEIGGGVAEARRALQLGVDRGRVVRVDRALLELHVLEHARDLRGVAQRGGLRVRQLGREAGEGDAVGVVERGRRAAQARERRVLAAGQVRAIRQRGRRAHVELALPRDERTGRAQAARAPRIGGDRRRLQLDDVGVRRRGGMRHRNDCKGDEGGHPGRASCVIAQTHPP